MAYLTLLASAVLICLRIEIVLDVLGGALQLLAIVNIRNAWDLTLAMVLHHRAGD